MDDRLTIFAVGDLVIDTFPFYSPLVLEDFAKGNDCTILEVLEFTGFVWVCVE